MRLEFLMIAVPAFALIAPSYQIDESDPAMRFALTNDSQIFNLTEPQITCYEGDETLKPTTVDTCRPALTEMRSFPDYSRTQVFKEFKYPKTPFTPPFKWQARGATCDIRLGAGDPKIEDKLSWKDLRTEVTNIVEDCQPPNGAGIGGWTFVGQNREFVLRVLGRDPLVIIE